MNGFSDEERQAIREEIIETGRQLIIRHGFKKTTVKDITEPVGIAESTFYLFFDSKAELYFEISLRAHEELIEHIGAELDTIDDPEEGIKRLFQLWVDGFERYPILENTKRESVTFYRDVDEDEVIRTYQEGSDKIGSFIQQYIEESDGLLHQLKPREVMHILQVLEGLALSSNDNQALEGLDLVSDEEDLVNEDRFVDIFISSLAKGLTVDEDAN